MMSRWLQNLLAILSSKASRKQSLEATAQQMVYGNQAAN
jgi:hypothetical protein